MEEILTEEQRKTEYLIFRYNLYMMEYMYDYIVEKILGEFNNEHDSVNRDVQKEFGKKSTSREFFYKMLATDRTRFSKYKNDGEYQHKPTSKMKNIFDSYPDLSPFIKGEKLIVQIGSIEENYNNEYVLELPEGTEESLHKAVDNAWKYVMNNKIFPEDLKKLAHVNGLAIWMCYRITEQYRALRGNREKIDYKIIVELDRIDKLFTIENLDEIEYDTLSAVNTQITRLYRNMKKIYDYKEMIKKMEENNKKKKSQNV